MAAPTMIVATSSVGALESPVVLSRREFYQLFDDGSEWKRRATKAQNEVDELTTKLAARDAEQVPVCPEPAPAVEPEPWISGVEFVLALGGAVLIGTVVGASFAIAKELSR